MNALELKWPTLAAVVVLTFGSASEVRAGEEQQGKPIIEVRAQDIPEQVKIVGRLGEPLGTLLTVRGKWVRGSERVKDRSLIFRVALINGRNPSEKIDFHIALVDSVFSPRKGHAPKTPKGWDWRFDWGGTTPPPTPLEGEYWEMLAVESGCYENYSPEAWREIGGAVIQSPPWMAGFYTQLKYIAVRRLGGKDR